MLPRSDSLVAQAALAKIDIRSKTARFILRKAKNPHSNDDKVVKIREIIENCEIMLNKIILITILMCLFGGGVMADNQNILELNSAMMRNTYKIEGKGSIGTCFLIGRPFKKDPTQASFVLVTAAHVLENMEGEEATIYLRKKQNDGLLIKAPWKIRIRQGNNDLWVKNNSGIDVAAIYVKIPEDADYQLLSTSMFADDKILADFEIHPGDEMYCLGFPFGTEANEEGFPILRSGKVASFPLIPTQKYKSFLLDFEVFRGNSGGPVYFVESNRNYTGGLHLGTIQFIAGIVSREFSVAETVESLYETKQQVHPLALAVVVHASYILETINQLPEQE